MSTMNPKSFARLMKLLDLAAVDIALSLIHICVSKQGTACQPPFHAADGSSRRRFSAGSMAAPDAAAPDFTKTGPV